MEGLEKNEFCLRPGQFPFEIIPFEVIDQQRKIFSTGEAKGLKDTSDTVRLSDCS